MVPGLKSGKTVDVDCSLCYEAHWISARKYMLANVLVTCYAVSDVYPACHWSERSDDSHRKSLTVEPFYEPIIFCKSSTFYSCKLRFPCLWVPVTTAWRFLRSRMEERPLIWRVAANKMNKQSRTADKGWSSSLGVGRGANNSSPWETKCYEILTGEMLPLETKQSGGKILPHSDLRGGVPRGGITQQEKEKGHFVRYMEC